MMMSIFSCASWPSICLLFRKVYLGLPPIYLLGCFTEIELHELFVFAETWMDLESVIQSEVSQKEKNTVY